MLDGGGGMLSAVVNRLRGEVRLRVEAAFPERLLNLCAERGISLWDLVWEGEGQFTCRLSRGDHRRLRGAAGKLDCRLTTLGRSGAPYFLRRLLLGRPALAAGGLEGICGSLSTGETEAGTRATKIKSVDSAARPICV